MDTRILWRVIRSLATVAFHVVMLASMYQRRRK